MSTYCRVCTLNDDIPGIILDNTGLCNVCNKDNPAINYKGIKEALKNNKEFEAFTESDERSGGYNCMLLYSGGMDGAYALCDLVYKRKMKPLIFTLNHPFKNKESIANIQNISKIVGVDHVVLSFDHKPYKDLMRFILTHNKGNKDIWKAESNKDPCIGCAGYLQIKAFLFAYEMNIPYIICVDPEQTNILPVNIFAVVKLLDMIYGEKFLVNLFDQNTAEVFSNPEKLANVPKIVYPFISGKPPQEEMERELESHGLYELSSLAMECRLHSLLDYYSLKQYKTVYYAKEIAGRVKNGTCIREDEIQFIEDYKRIILDRGAKDTLSTDEIAYITDILDSHRKNSSYKYESSMENVCDLWNIAEELDIALDKI